MSINDVILSCLSHQQTLNLIRPSVFNLELYQNVPEGQDLAVHTCTFFLITVTADPVLAGPRTRVRAGLLERSLRLVRAQVGPAGTRGLAQIGTGAVPAVTTPVPHHHHSFHARHRVAGVSSRTVLAVRSIRCCLSSTCPPFLSCTRYM